MPKYSENIEFERYDGWGGEGKSRKKAM